MSCDQTKTMAVQGAAPSRISPAMYCCASAGAIQAAKTCSKKSTASAAMVKGFTSQFTASVRISPFGRSPIWARLAKSTATIIG